MAVFNDFRNADEQRLPPYNHGCKPVDNQNQGKCRTHLAEVRAVVEAPQDGSLDDHADNRRRDKSNSSTDKE